MPREKPYRCVPLDRCLDEVALLGRRRPVVIVGSFISTYAPTSLPTGVAVAAALWELLFGGGWPAWFKRDFSHLPFESLMQCYPDHPRVPHIVRLLFGTDIPNPVHHALVRALEEGILASIVTTNYDRALEACDRQPSGSVTVTTEGDVNRRRPGSGVPTCFKIHGTACEGLEQTLVCDLAREGRLAPWKRKLLLELLTDRVVIVIGYSGRDFDICPELAEAAIPLELVWLQRTSALTANAQRALGRRRGTLITGDLLDFLNTLLPSAVAAGRSRQAWDPKPYFDTALLSQWRFSILNWMGCATLAGRVRGSFEVDILTQLRYDAALMGHTGKYADGARALWRAAALPHLTAHDQLECVLHAAGSWFIYGRYRKAWKLLRSVERRLAPTDDDLLLIAFELRMVMYMRLVQIAGVLHSSRLLECARSRSRAIYAKARPVLEAAGEWGRLAALQQNAERIGIADPEGLALPARQGYASLGQPSMDVIAKRDWLRTGPMNPAKERLGRWCIIKAERYGWDHEAWKFHWILLCRGNRRHWRRHLAGWWQHFRRTQYPPLGRVFQLLANIPRA